MNTPNFPLMKRSQIVSFFHLQMPRWLFSDPKYAGLSLHAKVTYTFLLNRYQLSQRNGWVSEQDEVFVIFTREELAAEMHVSYKKAIASFKELQDANLIWEQRRGRGLPNHIYLADVRHETSESYQSAPFCGAPPEAPRPDDREGLDDLPESKGSPGTAENARDSVGSRVPEPSMPAQDLSKEQVKNRANGLFAPVQDLSKEPVKTGRADSSAPVKPAGQELSQMPPSNTYPREIDWRDTEDQSVCTFSARGQTDGQALEMIYQSCGMEDFEPGDRTVLRDAIAWLFYAQEVRIGACCYAGGYVRSRLFALTGETLQMALDRLHENKTARLRNTLVYTAKVLFSCLTEREAQYALDPYLNGLRGAGTT